MNFTLSLSIWGLRKISKKSNVCLIDDRSSERLKFAGVRSHTPFFSSKNSYKQGDEKGFTRAVLSK